MEYLKQFSWSVVLLLGAFWFANLNAIADWSIAGIDLLYQLCLEFIEIEVHLMAEAKNITLQLVDVTYELGGAFVRYSLMG